MVFVEVREDEPVTQRGAESTEKNLRESEQKKDTRTIYMLDSQIPSSPAEPVEVTKIKIKIKIKCEGVKSGSGV